MALSHFLMVLAGSHDEFSGYSSLAGGFLRGRGSLL